MPMAFMTLVIPIWPELILSSQRKKSAMSSGVMDGMPWASELPTTPVAERPGESITVNPQASAIFSISASTVSSGQASRRIKVKGMASGGFEWTSMEWVATLIASPMTPARRKVTVPPESAGHIGAEDMLMPSPVGAMTGEK